MLVVQDAAGQVADANSYVPHDWALAWLSVRGLTDKVTDGLVIRATDFLDSNFSFPGEKKAGFRQTTQWPRVGVTPDFGDVPPVVKAATALTAGILVRIDARQAAAAGAGSSTNVVDAPKVLESTTVTVGPLTKSEKYTVLTGNKAAAVVESKEWDFEPVLRLLKSVFPEIKRLETTATKGSRWWNGEVVRR